MSMTVPRGDQAREILQLLEDHFRFRATALLVPNVKPTLAGELAIASLLGSIRAQHFPYPEGQEPLITMPSAMKERRA